MNRWLRLSGELYLFGPGGITRVLENTDYKTDGSKSAYITRLLSDRKEVGRVTESVDHIAEMLESVRKVRLT